MLYQNVLFGWLEEKKLEARNSTIENYQKCINRYIIPRFGALEVEDITKKMLQEFIMDFSATHKRNTVENLTKPLSGSLKWAEENGIIQASPWKTIKLPKDFSEKELPIFSIEEIKKILEDERCPQIKKDIIFLAYRTGMRIGEILALKWEDLNFNEGFLTVRRTLSGYAEITKPKTKSSRRRIDLDQKVLKMLKERYEKDTQHTYVFCKIDGSIYGRQAINLPKICRNAGVKPRCFHALRHTHATILLSAGVHPKIVQERLGHAKITTTLDTYSHLVPGMQKAAVNVFNDI